MAYFNVTLSDNLPYGTTGYSNTSSYVNVTVRRNVKSGGSTAGFKRLREEGLELPSISLDHIQCRASYPVQTVGSQWSAQPTVKLSNYGNWCVKPFLALSLPTSVHVNLYDKALGKIPERINGTQFSVPLFARDFKQTADMFLNACRSIRKTFSRRKRDYVINGKWTADNWLEYRMGWRLAIMDLYDAFKVLTDAQRDGPVIRIKVMSQETYSKSVYTSSGLPNYRISSGDFLADVLDTQAWDERCTISVRMKDSSFSGMGTLQQLGFMNPLSFFWDAVPLSFVLDWLTSIGDYLRTLDTFVGREFVSGTVSYSAQVNRKVKAMYMYPAVNSGWLITYLNLPDSSLQERYYKRVPLLAFPKATLPHVQINLNPQRVLDGLALLKQFSPVIKKTLQKL